MRLNTAAAVRVAAAAALMACANLGSPPGGPLRTTAPIVTAVSPDSGDTNVTARSVVFEFDAIVSDRELDNFFLISPREGEPDVRWRRNRVEVRPGRPFRPNTAYSVSMLPGIADLQGNALNERRTVVFSTGPTIPRLTIQGRVFDWMGERVAPGARVEAIRLPDSLPYVGIADSSGQFVVGPLDDGTYVVRATIDVNRNRALDPNEPTDTAHVIVRGGSPVLELLTIQRDTLPPRLLLVTAVDSVTIVAGFDRPIDPTQPIDSIFVVQRQDSTTLRIERVLTRLQRDSLRRARADTAASDTTARDTTARRPPADPRVEMLAQRLPQGATAPVRPSRRAPPHELTILLDPATPMQARTPYRVTARDVRGVNGRTARSDRQIQGPAPRDTSRATARPPDDSRRP